MPKEKKKKKFDFKKKKDNTLKSLGEVEKFLGEVKKIGKYANLYKFLKK